MELNLTLSYSAWYRQSHICYAYLADVRVPSDANSHTRSDWSQDWLARGNLGWFAQPDRASDTGDARKMFQDSRWWSRGWTLQELLAPERVMFFDAGWTPLGLKAELADWITEFTTIHKQALESPATIPGFSIAQRMSWAAERTTSVPEDMAYCLLGIFDINMPMIYGQGSKAFMKLQEGIVKGSDDQSILAWQDNTDAAPSGVFASSPAFFRHCGDVVLAKTPMHAPLSITNFGLATKLPLIQVDPRGIAIAQLNCCHRLYPQHSQHDRVETRYSTEFPVWIPLRHIGLDKWLRIHSPLSHVHLEYNYEDAADIKAHNVFLSVSSLATPAPPRTNLRPELGSYPAELFLTVGAGTTSSAGYFTRTSSFPLFSWTTILNSQGQLGLSHHLVSHKAFTTIFSLAWQARSISAVRFTTVNTSTLQFLESQTQNGRTWRDVLEDGGMAPFTGAINAAATLGGFHDTIAMQFGEVTEEAFPESPRVRVFAEPMQDLKGRLKVIVSYVTK